MLTRRVFFLVLTITAVSLIPVIVNLSEQESLVLRERGRWLGHDRSLLVVVYPKDTAREDLSERVWSKHSVFPAEGKTVENGSEEQETVSKEQGPVSKEQGTVSKEQGPVSKEQGTVSKEQGPVSKEQGPVSKEQGPVSKEQGSVSKEQGTVSKEQGTVSKEQGPVSKEQGTVSKEQGPFSKELGTVSNEQGPVSKEQGTVSKEQGPVSKEQGTVSKEQGPVSKEQGSVSKEQGPVSKEQGTVSKEQGTVTPEKTALSSLQERIHGLAENSILKQDYSIRPSDSNTEETPDNNAEQQVEIAVRSTVLERKHKHDSLVDDVLKLNRSPADSHTVDKPLGISHEQRTHDLQASNTLNQKEPKIFPVESTTGKPSGEELSTEKAVPDQLHPKRAHGLLESENLHKEGSKKHPTNEKLLESEVEMSHKSTHKLSSRVATRHKPKRVLGGQPRVPAEPRTQKPLQPQPQVIKISSNRVDGKVLAPSIATPVGNHPEWQPISQKTYKYNKTLHVKFPKPDMLYSKTPCTLTNVSNFPVERPRDDNAHELELVEQNLQKCLKAAELTEYFDEKNYITRARKNAANFLLLMRDVVTANYSANHTNMPCWKSQFHLKRCIGRNVEGHIGRQPFSFAGNLLTPELQHTVHFGYAGRVHSPAMCLPSIFVAGFPKCGSSFVYCLIQRLYQYKKWKFILQQPEKEPHFWVPGGPFYHHRNPHDLGDVSRYLLNFLPRAIGNTSFTVPIDASPNTLFQWPRYSLVETLENYCLAPSVLPLILPRAKYIVVLRDPVTMLYSAFWFSTSANCKSLNRTEQVRAPDDFHHRVLQKIRSYEFCTRFKPVDACFEVLYPPITGPVEYGSSQCGRVRLEVGFYYYYIRRWLAVIPREQFHFMTTEEMKKDYHVAAQNLSDFLDLGLDIIKRPFVKVNDKNCKNVQSTFDYRNDPELQMRNDTKRLLYKFFDPMNQKLAELLNDSKFLWKLQE